jgi:hypothetical protein
MNQNWNHLDYTAERREERAGPYTRGKHAIAPATSASAMMTRRLQVNRTEQQEK